MNLHTLSTDFATATFTTYGAQALTFYTKAEPQKNILWHTPQEFLEAAFAANKALRGGVPLCWPWFMTQNPTNSGPSHGLGRIIEWTLEDIVSTPQKSTALLTCTLDGTHPAWPYKTGGKVLITLTDSLTVSLTTTNLSTQPFHLKQALHTYLTVSDITQIGVEGLTGRTVRHVSSGRPLPAVNGVFSITEETEMLAHPVESLSVVDAPLNRTLTATNGGSTELIVWNPWAAKAATLDMPPEDYKHMLCLETANVDHAPTLQPGQSHTLSTTISTTR